MTQSEIKAFWDENGYYHAKSVFSPQEVQELESEFDWIVGRLNDSGEDSDARWGGEEMRRLDGGNSQITHTHNVQCFSAAWMRALSNARFLDAVEAMIGPDIMLHHSKLFQKPSEKGSPFPMHQDWTYFPSFEDSMLAGVIHVSDASDEMGCLRVVPGSHKLGRVEGTDGAQASELLDAHPIENATVVEAQAGDVVFFHYFTLHGSMPNRSQNVRKTVLAQLHSGNDAIEPRGEAHPNARLTLRGHNWRATRTLANAV